LLALDLASLSYSCPLRLRGTASRVYDVKWNNRLLKFGLGQTSIVKVFDTRGEAEGIWTRRSEDGGSVLPASAHVKARIGDDEVTLSPAFSMLQYDQGATNLNVAPHIPAPTVARPQTL
jgi:hypothetical protein